MNGSGASPIYEFGGFTLNARRRTLADRNGDRVPLKPKVFETLLYLVEHAGELQSKHDLLQAIWPNVVVEENNLNQHISKLRRILREAPGEHRFIVTETGRGYRFVAEVTQAEESSAPRKRRAALPEIDSALVSVAVLPFKRLGAAPDGYLEEAIPLELSSRLARVPGLRVVPNQTALAHSRQSDLATLARDLNVQYLIAGSVAEQGEQIRIIAELYEAADDRLLWSERYDASGGELLNIQQEIAESIVGAFGGERLRAEIQRTVSLNPADLDAWRLVQRARAYLLDYRAESVAEAIPLLRRAVESAPDYALAHAALAQVMAEAALNAVSADPAADRAFARVAAAGAEALSPHDPEVLRAAGAALAFCGDYSRSIELLRRAISESPYDLGAWGYLGWPLVATGVEADLIELNEILDRLTRLAPRHPGMAYWLFHRSVACCCQDECEEARKYAQLTTQLQPRFALAWIHLGNVLGRLAEPEPARAAVARGIAVNAHFTPEYYAVLMETLSDQPAVVARRTAGLEQARAPLR